MTPATTLTLDLQASYSRRFYVRRRRLAGKIYLIHLSRIFEVDEFSSTVWLQCDGTKDALQIARLVSDAFPHLGKGEIGALTLYNLQFFLDTGLIAALPAGEEG